MKDPLRVRMGGPLEGYAAGFAAELVAVGYRPAAAAIHLRLLAHLKGWLQRERFVPGELGEAELDRFRREHLAGYASLRIAQGLVPLLGYLRGLGVVPAAQPPAVTAGGELLERYRRYLTVERGLTVESARGYVDVVRPFIESRVSAAGELALWDLQPAEVLGFLLAESGRRSRKSAKTLVTAVRSLLGFLHVEGLVARLSRCWRTSGLRPSRRSLSDRGVSRVPWFDEYALLEVDGRGVNSGRRRRRLRCWRRAGRIRAIGA